VSRTDVARLIELLSAGDSENRDTLRNRVDQAGVDPLLDDPRTLNVLLTDPRVRVRPEVIFYVMVRHALLEGGVEDRGLADYVASVLFRFGRAGRAFKVSDGDDREYRYLVDLVADLREAEPRRRFMLELHLGDFALWISGLFPDYLESRARRRGAPPITYYEAMGTNGYRAAAQSKEAGKLGLGAILRTASSKFSDVRVALNRISDRHLWPGSGDPVGRVLREVSRGGI
jgi:hypothetical protein